MAMVVLRSVSFTSFRRLRAVVLNAIGIATVMWLTAVGLKFAGPLRVLVIHRALSLAAAPACVACLLLVLFTTTPAHSPLPETNDCRYGTCVAICAFGLEALRSRLASASSQDFGGRKHFHAQSMCVGVVVSTLVVVPSQLFFGQEFKLDKTFVVMVLFLSLFCVVLPLFLKSAVSLRPHMQFFVSFCLGCIVDVWRGDHYFSLVVCVAAAIVFWNLKRRRLNTFLFACFPLQIFPFPSIYFFFSFPPLSLLLPFSSLSPPFLLPFSSLSPPFLLPFSSFLLPFLFFLFLFPSSNHRTL